MAQERMDAVALLKADHRKVEALFAAFENAKVKVLSEMIEHHVEEEEKRVEGMFSQARKAGLDMDELGDRMALEKEELTAEYKRRGTPRPETSTLTGTSLA